jgi:AraC-like DNA-binding protein
MVIAPIRGCMIDPPFDRATAVAVAPFFADPGAGGLKVSANLDPERVACRTATTVPSLPAAMEAAPVLAIGQFRERPAAAFLRGAFVATWVHELPRSGAPPVVVAPDGTIDLQWIDGAFRVAGPDRDAQTEILPAGTTVIGFRFHPAAAARWLGVPAMAIVGRRLALDELWGARARRQSGAVRGGQPGADLVAALEAAIARGTPEDATIDASMRAAYDLIAAGPPPGAPLVPWLGRGLGMSERTLRRRFDESFGYGPKTLDRIMRYQRFRRLARGSKQSIAILAVEAGYADQAHLIRESRRLTGSTPQQLERMLRAGSA